MASKAKLSKPDRHLAERSGFFTYKRRVPARFRSLDSRFPIIRLALGTDDLGEARMKRDAHERADDEFWASLCQGGDRSAAEARYQAARSRAAALGFTYRHISSILQQEDGEAILARLKAVKNTVPASPEETAILGGVPVPSVSLWRAFEIYTDQIAADEVSGKSQKQYKLWHDTKKRAVASFEQVCGVKNIDEITRDDARKFHAYWLDRIAPNRKDEKKATHKPASGNRELGNMRTLYGKYYERMGLKDRKNPFDDLNFSHGKQRTRPPFPDGWIAKRILAKGVLDGLNDEATGIVHVLIETGCRPSEVANLTEKCIHLNEPIPYIKIEPRNDPDDPREVKTDNSIREIPLVGIALEAMKKFPKGFPRYKDNENSLSATVNKYMRENNLLPTEEHVVYCLRHSFERRAKDAQLDTEMRMMLMGHMIDRPNYGQGGSLSWKLGGLAKMVLPFDPAIV